MVKNSFGILNSMSLKIKLWKVVLLLSGCLMVFSSCKKAENKMEKGTVKKFYKQYASEYQIVQRNKQRGAQVSVSAPDFKFILRSLKKHDKKKISIKEIEEQVQKYPKNKKNYSFWVKKEKKEIIEKEFLEEISKDLILDSIKSIKFTEKWSTEE